MGELDGRLSAQQVAAEQDKAADKTAPKTEDEDEEQSALKEWVGLLVRAGTWALLIYTFLFQVSIVDGPSMRPTFQHEDKLVIDKLTYRLSSIHRNDVIVFETVDMEKTPRRPRDYIKRVIGLPGETVEVHDGSVWVDGVKLDGALERNFGPTQIDHNPLRSQKLIVPPRHYLVMGDNRGQSKDGRVQGNQSLGFVAAGQIKGLVRLRFWPWKSWEWFSRGQE